MAVIVATGPSLSPQQLTKVSSSDAVVFGVNNTWNQLALNVHVTVNPTWWAYYWEKEGHLRDAIYGEEFDAWCLQHPDMHEAFSDKINLFGWYDSDDAGLSDNPLHINIGHSSGFAALNVAYLMGCAPILLIGHDMKFPDDYNGRLKVAGGKRHYFGEYPDPLLHWPSARVSPTGRLDGLLGNYATAARQNKVEIINCTPGSAMECFPKRELDDYI